jgi:hypothetical protein
VGGDQVRSFTWSLQPITGQTELGSGTDLPETDSISNASKKLRDGHLEGNGKDFGGP